MLLFDKEYRIHSLIGRYYIDYEVPYSITILHLINAFNEHTNCQCPYFHNVDDLLEFYRIYSLLYQFNKVPKKYYIKDFSFRIRFNGDFYISFLYENLEFSSKAREFIFNTYEKYNGKKAYRAVSFNTIEDILAFIKECNEKLYQTKNCYSIKPPKFLRVLDEEWFILDDSILYCPKLYNNRYIIPENFVPTYTLFSGFLRFISKKDLMSLIDFIQNNIICINNKLQNNTIF